MYIELRRNTYHALHDIPKDLREIIGRGARFCQSLQTSCPIAAKAKGAALEAVWRSQIAEALKKLKVRNDPSSPLVQRILADDPENLDDNILFLIDVVRKKADAAARRLGISEDDPRYLELPEYKEARRQVDIARGAVVPFTVKLERWEQALKDNDEEANRPKTIEQKRRIIERFAERFPFVSDVTATGVQDWIEAMPNRDGTGKATADTKRYAFNAVRQYWRYLQAHGIVSKDERPFDNTDLGKRTKLSKRKNKRLNWSREDMVRLYNGALERDDQELADLIQIIAYTGARREDICAALVEKVGPDFTWFFVPDAKTPSGVRYVPVHPRIRPTIERLVRAAKDRDDAYLFESTPDRFGKRGNYLGERFGDLKRKLGYGPRHVLYSFRHTVIAELRVKKNNVRRDIVASIVGQVQSGEDGDGEDITFEHYGDEAGMTPEQVAELVELKMEAILKLNWPI